MIKKKFREQKVGETVKVKNEEYIRQINYRYSMRSYLSTFIGIVI